MRGVSCVRSASSNNPGFRWVPPPRKSITIARRDRFICTRAALNEPGGAELATSISGVRARSRAEVKGTSIVVRCVDRVAPAAFDRFDFVASNVARISLRAREAALEDDRDV